MTETVLFFLLIAVGAGLITYAVARKFLVSKKRPVRIYLTIVTFLFSAGIVGCALMLAVLMIFGR